MTIRATLMRQNDAKRIFKAAREAGFDSATIIIHPDGRVEAQAAFNPLKPNADNGNSWDDVLK